MVSSAIWAAQDGLLATITAALAAETATAKVPVELGTPLTVKPEHIWISGEVQDWNQEYTVSGLRQKDENFTLRICIAVQHLGLSYIKVRDRAKELGDIIENSIHADYTLGGAVMLSKTRGAVLEEALVGDKTRAVGLNIDVDIMATITA